MIETPGRFHSKATDHVVAGADEILDDELQKKQSEINAENESFKDAQTELNEAQSDFNSEVREALGTGGNVDERIANAVNTEKERAESAEGALGGRLETLEEAVGDGGSVDERIAAEGAKHYTKEETYNKTELNNLITTPNQGYITVDTYASLPATGSADTIYRVSNYDGSTSQVDATKYSEYAWDGTQYKFLCVKSQIGEVFDITAYNSNTKYADLAAALNGGANIPQSLQKGGMSVKFVQSSDNKYVQYRLMLSEFTNAQFTNAANWQGVDDKPTAGSDNLVKSGGVFGEIYSSSKYDGISEYQPIYGHIGITDKSIIDYNNGEHICVRVKPDDTISIVKGSRGYQKIAFVTDYDFSHSLPYPLLLTSQDAIYNISQDIQFTVPNNAKYMVMEYSYQGDSSLPSKVILNGKVDLMGSIRQQLLDINNELSTKQAEFSENLSVVETDLDSLANVTLEGIEQTLSILSKATFDKTNTEIYSYQYGNIYYIPVSSGKSYRILVKRTAAQGVGKIYTGFTTNTPAIGVEVSNIIGGSELQQIDNIINIKQNGYLLFYATTNIEYGAILLVDAAGTSAELLLEKNISDIKKCIFEEEEKTPSILASASFDKDNTEIYTFAYGNIRYIPVEANNFYRISVKRTSSQGVGRIYSGFTTEIPALGVEVSNIVGGELLQMDEEIFITQNGYLLYYIIASPEYEHIYKYIVREDSEHLNIPDYWKTYLDIKIALINNNDAAAGANGDSFVFITDTHLPYNMGQSPKLIKYITEHTSVKNVFFGGDTFESADNNAQALAYLREFRDAFAFTYNFFATRGNHDILNSLTEGQFFSVFNRQLDYSIVNTGHDYYCLDNTRQKIRYIVLDCPQATYSSTGSELDADQATWLENSITELTSDWSFVVIFHSYFIWNQPDTVVESIGASAISHINHALSTAQAQIIAVIVGHCHRDTAIQEPTNGYWIIATTCDYRSNESTKGTTNEQSFDVFSINKNTGDIKIIRIGQGNDRTFNYLDLT